MTSIEKQTRLSSTAVKEQLKIGSAMVNPDIKFSSAALSLVLAHIRNVYCQHVGKDIMAALEYSKSKTVTDKLLKVIKMTEWSDYPVPSYHIKMCTVLRLIKSVVPNVRIQQQVKVILQHHMCMLVFLIGYASAKHSIGNVVKAEDITYVFDNLTISPKSIVTPPIPRLSTIKLEENDTQLKEAIEIAVTSV
ncbi:short chain dehydrogenase [European chub iridovirus]|nr:short chain dehydrogenase [European chub iridovirus]